MVTLPGVMRYVNRISRPAGRLGKEYEAEFSPGGTVERPAGCQAFQVYDQATPISRGVLV
ncbi:MAG: hypothetical protein MJE77_30410 [Proteobacteria bacterium]|nr:hypothetical protein [Pseudomonadota bacterium]